MCKAKEFVNSILDMGVWTSNLCEGLLSPAGLAGVYKSNTAREEAQREDIESIQNLITRLDFNGFFAAKRQAVSSAQLLSRFALR